MEEKKQLTRKEKMTKFFVMVLNYLTLFIPALLKRWIANINKNKQVDTKTDTKIKENHKEIKKSIKNTKKK